MIFWDDTLPYPVLVVRPPTQDTITTWDAYQQLIDELYTIARAYDGYVYLIFDVGRAQLPPGNAVRNLRRGFEGTPDNVRAAYMITANPVVRRMVEIVMRLTMKHPAIRKYQFVYSADEARRRIRYQEGEYD